MDTVIVSIPLPSVEVSVDVKDTEDLDEITEKAKDEIITGDWANIQERVGNTLRYYTVTEEDIIEIHHSNGDVTISD